METPGSPTLAGACPFVEIYIQPNATKKGYRLTYRLVKGYDAQGRKDWDDVAPGHARRLMGEAEREVERVYLEALRHINGQYSFGRIVDEKGKNSPVWQAYQAIKRVSYQVQIA